MPEENAIEKKALFKAPEPCALGDVDQLLWALQDAVRGKNLAKFERMNPSAEVWGSVVRHPKFPELVDAILVMLAMGQIKVSKAQMDGIKMLAARCGIFASKNTGKEGNKVIKINRATITQAAPIVGGSDAPAWIDPREGTMGNLGKNA